MVLVFRKDEYLNHSEKNQVLFVLISSFEPSQALHDRSTGTCIPQDCKACAPFIGALCHLLQSGIKIFKQSNFIHTQHTLPAQKCHTHSLHLLILLYLHLLPLLHNHPTFAPLSCPPPPCHCHCHCPRCNCCHCCCLQGHRCCRRPRTHH